jgi:hypothetical protein
MTDKNVSEKLSETLSNLIKKTNTFEKVDGMLKCVSIFMLITGVVTFFNYYKIEKLQNNLYKKDEELYLHLFKTIMEVKKINKKLDTIIEINEDIGLLIENHMKEHKTLTPSLSYLSNNSLSTKSFIPFDYDNYDYNIENNDIDDELLNECYDNIPCNNSKKATGLNRIFEWK